VEIKLTISEHKRNGSKTVFLKKSIANNFPTGEVNCRITEEGLIIPIKTLEVNENEKIICN